MTDWSVNSWRDYEAKHIPIYPEVKKLREVVNKLKNFPPLVFSGEIRSLKNSLSDVAEGNAFLLQCGDCAESFSEFHADNIRDCLLYTSPSPRDTEVSRMPSSA